MTNYIDYIGETAATAVRELYGVGVEKGQLQLQPTRKEFEGDVTLVVFPLLKVSRKSPEATATEIGEWISGKESKVECFNVVKGFLNIKLSSRFWGELLHQIASEKDFGQLPPTGKTVMVEFSSPNTNKPLHLGHVRNNLLGWSVSKLLEANGHRVLKVNLVNDRGIHICKSMIAWLKCGDGITPESSGKKGDHLIGDFYVKFNDLYKKEVEELVAGGMAEEEAEKNAPILKEAQAMLVKWEQGDEEVRSLWKKMNGWVYDGFARTYGSLGISFDRTYYESNTYLLGKSLVDEGLKKGVFERYPDGSVWCNLEGDGLDRKLLLRSDGTSVYMTQDLGTACERYREFHFDEHIYVVGNEQNYHFQVLKLILGKLGFEWSDAIYHLSYGMVELPEGKMKSREGTVVDADDLIEKMFNTARETSQELGKLDGMSDDEKDSLYRILSMGALKYFIIKVDPKKTMLFDPKESIDFNGNTGPFIQYTHARIRSILRKAGDFHCDKVADLLPKEEELISILASYPDKVREAGNAHSPAVIANYAYDLAKGFNQYYHDTRILQEEDEGIRRQRLMLLDVIARVLTRSMGILGIELPERM